MLIILGYQIFISGL